MQAATIMGRDVSDRKSRNWAALKLSLRLPSKSWSYEPLNRRTRF